MILATRLTKKESRSSAPNPGSVSPIIDNKYELGVVVTGWGEWLHSEGGISIKSRTSSTG